MIRTYFYKKLQKSLKSLKILMPDYSVHTYPLSGGYSQHVLLHVEPTDRADLLDELQVALVLTGPGATLTPVELGIKVVVAARQHEVAAVERGSRHIIDHIN
jgi:hypothetical protein